MSGFLKSSALKPTGYSMARAAARSSPSNRMLENGRNGSVTGFFMAINLILGVFVWLVVPETKGIALEEMDVLFGGTNHVSGGAELVELRKPKNQSGVEPRNS